MSDPERFEEYKIKSKEHNLKYKQKIKNDPVKLQKFREKATERMKAYRLKKAIEQKIQMALPKIVANKNKSGIQNATPKQASSLNRAFEKVEQVFEAALPKEKSRRDHIKQMFLEKCLADVTKEIENDKKKMNNKKTTKKFLETECVTAPQNNSEHPVELDELKIKEEDECIYYETIDDAYCRCCFKIFTLPSERTEIDQNFLKAVREIFQMGLTFKQGSRWICERCLETVMKFKNFKKEITFKQSHFSILLNRGDHEDLMEIHKVSEKYVENENLRPAQTPKPSLKKAPVRQEDVIIKEESNSIFVAELDQIQEADHQVDIHEILNLKNSEIHVLPKISYIRKRCSICKRSFQDLLGHKIKQHGHKQVFSCSACDFNADTRPKVTSHIQFKHSNYRKKKTCEICGKLVIFLDDHIQNVHHGVKNYFCDLCGFSSYGKNLLHSHILNCHLPKSVKCSQCDFTTINNIRLKSHIMNMHKIQSSVESDFSQSCAGYWQCPYEECKKILKKKRNLEDHIKRIHLGESNFKCNDPKCKKLFYTRREMLFHFSRVHGKPLRFFYIKFYRNILNFNFIRSSKCDL